MSQFSVFIRKLAFFIHYKIISPMQYSIPEYNILPLSTLLEDVSFNRWFFFPSFLNNSPQDLLFGNIIIVKKNDAYEVVIGHSSVLFAESNEKITSLGCKIIPSDSTSEDILKLILCYHHKEIDSSPILKANFLRLCLKHYSRTECIQIFSKTFPGKLSHSSFVLYEKLLLLDDEYQQLIHTGIVSEKILQSLLKLEKNEFCKVVALIKELQLGGNKQKQLMELFRDLCPQYDTTIPEILDQSTLLEQLSAENKNIPQITNNFFTFLREKASPLSNQARKEFNSKKLAMKLPQHCELHPSKSFEKDEVTFIATFTSLETFEKKWAVLKDIFND